MENTNMRKVAIDLNKANVFSVLIFFGTAVLFFVPFLLIWMTDWSLKSFLDLCNFPVYACAIIGVSLFLGIVVHELIHGATWACFAKNGWKSISFGVIWKYLTPYCHCDVPLTKMQYQIGALMPLIILGIIPAVAALFLGNILVLIFGIIFIGSAAGDIWMSLLLAKEDDRCLFLDHPSEAGFYVIDPSSESKESAE